jgi:hypothetical protein
VHAGAQSRDRRACGGESKGKYREHSPQPQILSADSEWLPVQHALIELEQELSIAALKVLGF